jgi:ribosomal protein L32
VPAELELTDLTTHLRGQGRLVAQTVYECTECGERYLGERRCPDCGIWCRRVGVGGTCPECDHPLLVAELLAEDAR